MNENSKRFALRLATVGLAAHFAYDYGDPIEVCSKNSPPQLPACGTQDEAPAVPPWASVAAATASSNTTATVIVGGIFVNTITDEEHAVPPSKPQLIVKGP